MLDNFYNFFTKINSLEFNFKVTVGKLIESGTLTTYVA